MKKYKLPKDSLVEPEQDTQPGDRFIDGQDVEGHGLPTTAPPSLDPQRRGGEVVSSPDESDDSTD
jgi:hypothetical protein